MTKRRAISSTATSKLPLACTPRGACPPRTANPNPAVFVGAKIGPCASTIELDPKHVDVAVRRWANLSGETALHAETGLTFAEESVGRASNFKQSPTLSPYQDLAQAPEQVRNRMHAA